MKLKLKHLKFLVFLFLFGFTLISKNKIIFLLKKNKFYKIEQNKTYIIKFYGLDKNSLKVVEFFLSNKIGQYIRTQNAEEDSFQFEFYEAIQINIEEIYNILLKTEIFEKIAVKKYLGDEISIRVEKRDFIGKINLKYSDEDCLVDSQGIVSKINEYNEKLENENLIIGIDIINIENFLKIYNFLKKEEILDNFKKIIEIGNRRFNLISFNEILIKLPQNNWDKALIKIKEIDKLSGYLLFKKKDKFDYIDMRFNDRIIYKKKYQNERDNNNWKINRFI